MNLVKSFGLETVSAVRCTEGFDFAFFYLLQLLFY
jgi:hypothetical protein